MRLIALLLTLLGGGTAQNASVSEFDGVWVHHPTSGFGLFPLANRVVLSVTGDGDRLRVIEIIDSDHAVYVVARQYFFGEASVRGVGDGTAKAAGQTTILHYLNQLERWNISKAGSELIVTRWAGDTTKANKRVLIFRRSHETDE
jgi:hypothetical protein